jgi:hypothetical protein
MKIEDLRKDAVNAARAACSKVESVPADILPPGAAATMQAGLAQSAWRAGFVAGWAMREVRDDEPPVGSMIWLRDHEGDPYVAVRRNFIWSVTGRHEGVQWQELLESVAEWGWMRMEGE